MPVTIQALAAPPPEAHRHGMADIPGVRRVWWGAGGAGREAAGSIKRSTRGANGGGVGRAGGRRQELAMRRLLVASGRPASIIDGMRRRIERLENDSGGLPTAVHDPRAGKKAAERQARGERKALVDMWAGLAESRAGEARAARARGEAFREKDEAVRGTADERPDLPCRQATLKAQMELTAGGLGGRPAARCRDRPGPARPCPRILAVAAEAEDATASTWLRCCAAPPRRTFAFSACASSFGAGTRHPSGPRPRRGGPVAAEIIPPRRGGHPVATALANALPAMSYALSTPGMAFDSGGIEQAFSKRLHPHRNARIMVQGVQGMAAAEGLPTFGGMYSCEHKFSTPFLRHQRLLTPVEGSKTCVRDYTRGSDRPLRRPRHADGLPRMVRGGRWRQMRIRILAGHGCSQADRARRVRRCILPARGRRCGDIPGGAANRPGRDARTPSPRSAIAEP